MTYAFIDTNVLLHFKVFEGIKWKDLLNDKDIVLVVCPTVIDEIDKYKDSTKSKVRNRARSIYKILSDYMDGKICCGIELIFCKQGVVNSSTSNYSNGREDEYIISAVKAFNTEERKVIVSHDTGMKFRAKQADLDFILLEDIPENRLSQEPTDEEKRIKELEREVALYKNRRSKPTLTFRNGESSMDISQYVIPDFSSEIEIYRNKLIEENQPFHYIRPNVSEEQVRQLVCPYSDEEIAEYNSSLTAYIERAVKIKNIQLHTSIIDKHVFELKFSIFNNGTEPTGKMGVHIIYPEGIIVVDENSYYNVDMTLPEKPTLQTKQERYLSELAKRAFAIQRYDFVNHRFYTPENRAGEYHWDVKKSTLTSSFVSLPSLNHNFDTSFEIPDKIFVFAREKGNYIIHWTILDESNIDPIVGELVLRVI
ncbi:MAG: hypothetical protein HDS13_01945 [Bacteroides sp.]|nr:hypothetical protein [Bacteroides sp.]